MNKVKTLLKSPKKLYLMNNTMTPKFSIYKDLKNHCRTITCQKIFKPKSNKILYSNNPYDDITNQQMPILIQRLNDPPEKLYQAIKIRRNIDVKYKLLFKQTQRENKTFRGDQNTPGKSKSHHLLPQSSNQLGVKKNKVKQNLQREKERIQALRQNIKRKRMQYEQQYKKIFENKKQLQITTDLPKIGRIRQHSINKKYQELAGVNNSANIKSFKKLR